MTQTAQHTPGPWKVKDYYSIIFPDDGSDIAKVSLRPDNRGDYLESVANAHLIAAAPEMLDALEFVAMTFADIEASERKGYFAECPKIVSAAIAKATA